MTIKVYTEMDSLFDARRGIITLCAKEAGNTKFNWDKNFKEIYARRRFDVFNQPELGITQEAYKARYEKRTIADFADETQAYIRPSKLINNIFKIVREIEFGVGQIISAATFDLTVNVYPYELSDELLTELSSVIKGAVPFNISLSFVYTPYDQLVPTVLHSYQFVFIYDFLTSEHRKAYWEKYIPAAATNTKFIVSDIILDKELPEEMRSEKPITLISNLNATQGGKITWVPYPKTIFDYKE